MRSDLVDIIDAVAVVDGTVSIKRLAPVERDAIALQVVWTYSDRRAPQTVIRFGDTDFRPKGGRKGVVIDTGGPEYDYEIKAILLLLYHVGTREGAMPYKWLSVLNRVRTLMRLARYCLARGSQSFRDLADMPAIKLRTLLLDFLNTDDASGGMNSGQWTSSAKTFRDAAKHLADYGLVRHQEFMPVLDQMTLVSIRRHEDEHRLKHPVIPTRVMKELIEEASAYVARAEQQYAKLDALMAEVDDAIASTRCRQLNAVAHSSNGRAYRRLSALLRDHYIELQRHVYVLALAFTGMRDSEVYDLKTDSSGIRDETGGPVCFVRSLLSKTDDEAIELDWVANAMTHKAIVLLSRVNRLFYRRAELLLSCHRSKMTQEQAHRLEQGLLARNLFGVRFTSGGSDIFMWTGRANDNAEVRLSLKRYAIGVTEQDVSQLERLECNYRSVSRRHGMRGKPYRAGDRFNFTPHQFRHTFAWFIVANRLGDIDDIRYQFKHLTRAMTLIYSERAYQTLSELRAAIEYFETMVNQHAIDDIVQSAEHDRIAGGGGERLARLLHELNDGQAPAQYSSADQPHFRNRKELVEFATRYSGAIRGLPHGYCTKGAACKIRNAADPSHCLYCDTYFATERHLPYWRVIKVNCEARLHAIGEMPEAAQRQFVAFRQTLEDNLFAANRIIERLAPAGTAEKEAR
ncbi:hypothetical protein [Burkholderia ubonensis]|uniref:hypothetical protein n=1 Tax=Burkholderia ubonensis TaxID=101571 RepID=UPI000755D1B6|nr:hypothetical protein [Burkholderia ubonensis]KVC71727.1 hypothetical protein WI75_25415 [Burkholderia ubonensis]